MLKMKLIASLLLIVLTTALIGGLTGAWFTDADTAGTATFTAGTLSIDVTDGLDLYNTLLTTPEDMYPGDVFDEIEIEITNTGSKDLAWFGNWTFMPETSGDGKLLDKIYIKSMGMYFEDEDGNLWNSDPWYQGYRFIENGVGNLLAHNAGEAAYYDTLAAADPNGSGVITLRQWNNNHSMILNTMYEQMGALKPNGNKYVITVEFGFHESAGNAYQAGMPGVSPITIGFEVDATQVNEAAINEMIPGKGTAHIGHLNNQIIAQP